MITAFNVSFMHRREGKEEHKYKVIMRGREKGGGGFVTCEALQVVVGWIWMDAVALKGWIYHVKIWAEKNLNKHSFTRSIRCICIL